MTFKTMLLGGAVALALSGAAYAQAQQTAPQATPGTDQTNAAAPAATQPTTGNEAATPTTKTSTHHRHYRHHVQRHMRTAMLRHHKRYTGSSAGEREATRNLNQQQLQGGAMQATSAGGNMGNMNDQGTGPGAPAGYTPPPNGAPPAPNMQPTPNANPPGNANYTQPATGAPNPPSNATYTQPQGSPGMQPGNAGYQQPGPNGAPPAPPADQTTTPPPSSNPGPSS